MEITKRNFKKVLRELDLSKYPSLDDFLRKIKDKLVNKIPLSIAEELMTFPRLKNYFENFRKEQNKYYISNLNFNEFSHRPPKPFQIDGIKFLLLNDRAILADDMGLGKSIQSILSALMLPENYKILIVTLKSLKYNIEEEIKPYSNSYKVIEKEWESGYKFTIVHYEALKKWKKQIIAENFHCVISDECFTYDTLVKTNKGNLKIGDIVEKKLKVKVLSNNIITNKLEHKKIINYWKNSPKDTLLKIKLTDGVQYLNYELTHNHKIYIVNENRYVPAIEVKKGSKVLLLQKRNWKEFLVELFRRMFIKNKN